MRLKVKTITLIFPAITTGFTKRTGKRVKRKGGQAAINAHAVRAVVQILTVTGRSYTIETLREELRGTENPGCERERTAHDIAGRK